MTSASPPTARVRTVPVLAVLVCHDGERWLRTALSAVRRSAPRPRHVLAVDTGSTDRTPELLAEAAAGPDAVLDGVLTLDRTTGFGAAVAAALEAGVTRWGDPGEWLWLLHDDCAPEPTCLGVLLNQAELSPSAGMLGPLAVDWVDPRLVVEAGLSTDASGHRQAGLGPAEPVGLHYGEQSTEVLAVPSAGALVRRAVWTELGGYDPALPLLRDDLDFGWRVNRAGQVVLAVPAAHVRHVRALTRGLRPGDAIGGRATRAVDRAHGLRTLLANRGRLAYLLGVPRLLLLGVLRALGFVLLRRVSDARAELAALGYLLGGRAGLRAARAARRRLGPAGQVRGLLTSRTTRLRNLLSGGIASWVRHRVAADAALGRLPESAVRAAAWTAPEAPARRPVGPAALPAGALPTRTRHPAGLRRPTRAVVVPLAEPEPAVDTGPDIGPDIGPVPPTSPAAAPPERPSPVPRGSTQAPPRQELVLIELGRAGLARQVLLAPPVLLVLGLAVVSLLTNAGRLGLRPSGGSLLPVPGLAAVWSGYVATWHGVAGGTVAPAPAALAILGLLGAPFLPLGGPPAAVAVLLFGDAPLAGLFGYLATRRLPVRREARALVAAGYALLPPATAGVAQGRLDVVVAHLLLPGVLAGIVAVVNPMTRQTSLLSTATGTSIGIAVLGAFAPLVHAVVVLVALAGFVAVAGPPGRGRQRAAALFTVVLVPLALLVPWPAAVLAHPAVLLSGVSAQSGQPTALLPPATPATSLGGLSRLVMLDPGGPGVWLPAGLAVLVATVVVVVLRPRRGMLPGFGLLLLGAAGVGVVAAVSAVPADGLVAQRFWAGEPMIVVGGALLWMVLAGCRYDRRRVTERRLVRVLATVGVLAVLVLAAGDLLAGRSGPLRGRDPETLAAPLTAELADTGRSVLVLAAGGAPTRQAAGRLPAYGDDDIAPVAESPARLAVWDAQLLSGNPDTVRTAVAQAVTAGVLFVVLPDQAALDPLRTAAGELAAAVGQTSAGRPVVRLQPAGGAATLISPALARQAISGGTPPTTLGAAGISPVAVTLPDVALRVSEGAADRLLVLAAEDESGWQATLNGAPTPIVRAWGHLVAVDVPLNGADIRISQPATLRYTLLLAQAAVWLFAALTALPRRPAVTR